jgi:hypothetical protein
MCGSRRFERGELAVRRGRAHEAIMNKMGRRQLLVSGVGGVVLGAAGCGWILHPERTGRRGGAVDTQTLVFDLLWLIPGLLPGVVFLLVDFTTGCIYGSGGGFTQRRPRAIDSSGATVVEVELDGEIVASGKVEHDRQTRLTFTRAVDEASLRAKGRVVVRTKDGDLAEGRARDLIVM